MNIIICGAGTVGFTIAKLLTEQNHSITVIDQSGEDIKKINDSLDVKAIVGKATYPSILEKAEGSKADMIIALDIGTLMLSYFVGVINSITVIITIQKIK